jgi:hypothetical protein
MLCGVSTATGTAPGRRLRTMAITRISNSSAAAMPTIQYQCFQIPPAGSIAETTAFDSTPSCAQVISKLWFFPSPRTLFK